MVKRLNSKNAAVCDVIRQTWEAVNLMALRELIGNREAPDEYGRTKKVITDNHFSCTT